MAGAKLQKSHGFVCRNIHGIFLQHMVEKRTGIGNAVVVGEKIGTDCVGLGWRQGLHFEGGVVHIVCDGTMEESVSSLANVAFKSRLQLLEIAEGLGRRSYWIYFFR